MNRDQALSKIKKCLALAKSSNPHEAAAAMRQAQKLMAEHNVTQTDVSLADVNESATPTQLKTLTRWEHELADMICNAFGCAHIAKVSRALTKDMCLTNKREYIFVGVGAAPQVASYAYEVLSRQCAADRLAHIRKQPKSCKPITKTARGDRFALGWVYGVETLVNSFAGSESNQRLIEQYMAKQYPDLTHKQVKDRAKGRNVSYNDFHQGRVEGSKAELNRGVGGVAERGLLA